MKKSVVVFSLALALGTYGCSSNEKQADVETPQVEQENPAIDGATEDTEAEVESEQSDYSFGQDEPFANETEEEAADPSLGAGSSGRGH